jgi:hypothetical protein
LGFSARLNRLRKKSERKANSAKDGLAGAKAQLVLLALSARLNGLGKKSRGQEKSKESVPQWLKATLN